MEETKTFYAKITELQTGVQYYFRAYAKSNQQAYGPIIPVFLKTINIGKNTLEQTNDTSVLIETEINFTDVSIIQHGHCYSKYPNPDINGLHTELGILHNNENSFSSYMKDLERDEKYYFRGYIQTNDTIMYSDELQYDMAYPFSIPDYPDGYLDHALKFTIDGDIYVMGFDYYSDKNVWMFDLEHITWNQTSSFPGNLAYSNAYTISNAGHGFYVMGSGSNRVIGRYYNKEIDGWKQLTTLNFNYSANSIYSFYSTNRLFISVSDCDNNRVHLYELIDEEWLERSSRDECSSQETFLFELNGKAYWADADNNFRYLWEYDITTDIWTKKGNPPQLNMYFYYDHNLSYIYRGKAYVHSSNGLVYRYNIENDEWIQVNDFDDDPGGCSIAMVVNDVLFIGMGNNNSSFFMFKPE
jgi:hypothetical protein